MKIAVFGSASDDVAEKYKDLAREVGVYLAEKDVTIVTGGSAGIPGEVVKSANKAGAKTVVYSPDHDINLHNERSDNLAAKYFDEHNFIPGFTARSLEMIKNVDAALIINGRIGTLSEFTIAVEEGLPVGVIKGSGGIADHVEYIIHVANKEFPQPIILDESYQKVIDQLIHE